MGTGVTALGSGSVGIGPGFWFSFDIRVYNIAFLFARDVCTGKVFGNFFFFCRVVDGNMFAAGAAAIFMYYSVLSFSCKYLKNLLVLTHKSQ